MKNIYLAPCIKVVRFTVEQGFAASPNDTSFMMSPLNDYGTEGIQQHGDVIGRDALTRI